MFGLLTVKLKCFMCFCQKLSILTPKAPEFDDFDVKRSG